MTQDVIDMVGRSAEVVIDSEPKDLLAVQRITSLKGKKILAIDPDFCNWELTGDTMRKIPNLKAIVSTATDYSWIDTDYARENGIEIVPCKGFSTESVAMYGLGMMINLSRRLPNVIKNDFEVDYNEHFGVDLVGKKVGVVGLGNIGTRFAELAKGIGMEVSYWSRSTRDVRFEYKELNEILSSSDVVYFALGTTDQIVSDQNLELLGRKAMVLTNAKKGYNHEKVIELAESGEIYGYSYESTKDAKNLEQFQGNVMPVLTVGWATEETFKKNGEIWVASILKHLGV